jgi:hypothetical protein
MARPFLFGGSGQQAQSKYLVEFKAGKMQMRGNMVHPISKKGTVYLNQTDDALIHFCWKDRTSGQTEDDLIIFPDDAEFKRVDACKDGRVYVLKFKNSSKRNFYWLQEPSDEKDEENCTKINEFINNPPTPGSRSGGSGAGALADISAMNDSDLQNLLNNMSPQQMMQLLSGGVGGLQPGGLAGLLGAGTQSSSRQRTAAATASAAPAAAPAATPAVGTQSAAARSSTTSTSGTQPNAAIQLSDLQNIISGLTVPTGGAAAAPASDQNIDLSHSINYEALKPLLTNPQFMDRVKEHLPQAVGPDGQSRPVTGENAPEQFAGTVSSPQFQQALSIFSAALQSGQLGPLVAQFDLGPECVDAANRGDLEAFVKALDKQSGKKPDDKKDDEMALD